MVKGVKRFTASYALDFFLEILRCDLPGTEQAALHAFDFF